MCIIPTETEMVNICDDLQYYARTGKIDGLAAVSRFLKRIGQRDLIAIIRNYLFDNACFTYRNGKLIPEHQAVVSTINVNFR